MRNKINPAIFKTLAVVFILLFFTGNALPKLIANTTEEAFQEPTKSQVRLNVIEAAGYFLKSQSDMLLLSNKIELEEIYGADYTELRNITNNAISDMENAKTKYAELARITETAPYNQAIIDKLMNFNYSSFQESRGFNSVLSGKVQAYLAAGDVQGVFSKLFSDTQGILDRLHTIQSALIADSLPSNSDLWRTNQSFSETLLFGQYSAEIFYNVTGN